MATTRDLWACCYLKILSTLDFNKFGIRQKCRHMHIDRYKWTETDEDIERRAQTDRNIDKHADKEKQAISNRDWQTIETVAFRDTNVERWRNIQTDRKTDGCRPKHIQSDWQKDGRERDRQTEPGTEREFWVSFVPSQPLTLSITHSLTFVCLYVSLSITL